MADTKLTGLSAITTASGGLLYVVNDASGSPVSRKMAFDVGTWTPTLTNTTNVASSSALLSQYYRIGSMVTASGIITVDVTSAANTVIKLSLPISSNFSAVNNLAGSAVAYDGSAVNELAQIVADTTNDVAQMQYVAVATAARSWAFHFTYRVI